MSIPGMRLKIAQASSFEIDGGPLDNIPIMSVNPKINSRGSTSGNIGNELDARQRNSPTPLNANLEGITIRFASIQDKAEKIIDWYLQCTNSLEREWNKYDINIKTFDGDRKVVEEWEVQDCYPDTIDSTERDSASNENLIYTMTLRGSYIEKKK